MIFSFEITNGGYIKYIDRDAHPNNTEAAPRIRVDLNGRTVSRKSTFHWDLMEPLQRCVRDHGLQCTKPPVFTPDATTNVSHVNSYQIQLQHFSDINQETIKWKTKNTTQSEQFLSPIERCKNRQKSILLTPIYVTAYVPSLVCAFQLKWRV